MSESFVYTVDTNDGDGDEMKTIITQFEIEKSDASFRNLNCSLKVWKYKGFWLGDEQFISYN